MENLQKNTLLFLQFQWLFLHHKNLLTVSVLSQRYPQLATQSIKLSKTESL